MNVLTALVPRVAFLLLVQDLPEISCEPWHLASKADLRPEVSGNVPTVARGLDWFGEKPSVQATLSLPLQTTARGKRMDRGIEWFEQAARQLCPLIHLISVLPDMCQLFAQQAPVQKLPAHEPVLCPSAHSSTPFGPQACGGWRLGLSWCGFWLDLFLPCLLECRMADPQLNLTPP